MKLKYLIAIFVASILFASCLKSKNGLLENLANGPGSILVSIYDIVLEGGSTDKTFALEGNPPVETLNLITLKLSAPKEKPSSDISATITVDNSGIPAGFIPLPANAYSISSMTIKIPKDSGVVVIPITITKATLDPSKQYALGIKLSTVSEGIISPTGNYFVVKFLVKNKYDGIYKVTGTLVDRVNSNLTGNYPLEFELRSTGANTNAVFDHSTGTQTHLILNGGAPSQYGSFGLNITFDLVTNKITSVVNAFGQPAGNGRSAALDPTGINAYDPASKTIRIKYSLLQPGTTVRTTFDETWVYTGPR